MGSNSDQATNDLEHGDGAQHSGATILDKLEEEHPAKACSPKAARAGTLNPTDEEKDRNKEQKHLIKACKSSRRMVGATIPTQAGLKAGIIPGHRFDANGLLQPSPAPVKRKRRKPEAIRHIVIHEPITFSRDQAVSSLTSKCLGVHYTIDRDGSIQQHADPAEITIHAGFMNNDSVSIEMINNMYMFKGKGANGKAIPFESERKGRKQWKDSIGFPLRTLPDHSLYKADGTRTAAHPKYEGLYQDLENRKIGIPFLTRRSVGKAAQARGKDIYKSKRNYILPTEEQMIALYNLVEFLVREYPNLNINFPGVNICHILFGGFRWRNTSAYIRNTYYKKQLKKASGGKADEFIYAGGISAHARTANHGDGLFYEHYLYSRYLYRSAITHENLPTKPTNREDPWQPRRIRAGVSENLRLNHKTAWNQTVAALDIVSSGKSYKEDKAQTLAAKQQVPPDKIMRTTEASIVHGKLSQTGDIRNTGPIVGFKPNAPYITNYHRSAKVYAEACKMAGEGVYGSCNTSIATGGRSYEPQCAEGTCDPGREGQTFGAPL